MMYSQLCQLSPLEVHAVAPFSFGLPRASCMLLKKRLLLPSKSEVLGKGGGLK